MGSIIFSLSVTLCSNLDFFLMVGYLDYFFDILSISSLFPQLFSLFLITYPVGTT